MRMRTTTGIFVASNSLHSGLPDQSGHVGSTTRAGLYCRHDECHTIFSDLDDATAHAEELHSRQLLVYTCVIHEVTNAAGEIELATLGNHMTPTP